MGRLIVALGVHVLVILTRTPLVNKESTPWRLLEDAVVDVEIDRCVDENSASNYVLVALLISPSFNEAPSIKTRHRPGLVPSRPHANPTQFPQYFTDCTLPSYYLYIILQRYSTYLHSQEYLNTLANEDMYVLISSY